jgi:hypothetical protein
MSVRQLDSNGDMTFGQSMQNIIPDSAAAIAQIVETTLRLWLGEWYLDVTQGTPYIQGVLGITSQATADQTLISQILTVDGMVDVANWESTVDPVTRQYSSLSATLITIYGETQLQIDNLREL